MSNERKAEYLGDGVYASFDGHHIWLRTGAHEGEHVTNTIALEPTVYAALVRYHAGLVWAAAEPEPSIGKGGGRGAGETLTDQDRDDVEDLPLRQPGCPDKTCRVCRDNARRSAALAKLLRIHDAQAARIAELEAP